MQLLTVEAYGAIQHVPLIHDCIYVAPSKNDKLYFTAAQFYIATDLSESHWRMWNNIQEIYKRRYKHVNPVALDMFKMVGREQDPFIHVYDFTKLPDAPFPEERRSRIKRRSYTTMSLEKFARRSSIPALIMKPDYNDLPFSRIPF
ncbi:MAG TPA: hypothetical protein VGT05_04715 [Patescibacteria group bacterium]|nr:hypothetical protein [Patescibacteria group bacterium]